MGNISHYSMQHLRFSQQWRENSRFSGLLHHAVVVWYRFGGPYCLHHQSWHYFNPEDESIKHSPPKQWHPTTTLHGTTASLVTLDNPPALIQNEYLAHKLQTLRFFHQYFLLSLPACCSNWDAPCCRASEIHNTHAVPSETVSLSQHNAININNKTSGHTKVRL